MPDPTLADFQRAFERMWSRWPDAPRLDPEYEFHMGRDVFGHATGGTVLWRGGDRPIDGPAALALCVVTAMEIGAWWEKRAGGMSAIEPCKQNGWFATVWVSGETLLKLKKAYPSLPSACLAALVAMGEGGGE